MPRNAAGKPAIIISGSSALVGKVVLCVHFSTMPVREWNDRIGKFVFINHTDLWEIDRRIVWYQTNNPDVRIVAPYYPDKWLQPLPDLPSKEVEELYSFNLGQHIYERMNGPANKQTYGNL
jgi:hypothetical protein